MLSAVISKHPPLDRQMTAVAQKLQGDPLSQGLKCPPLSHAYCMCHLTRQCLSGYPVIKGKNISLCYGRLNSETLNTNYSTSDTVTHKPYIIMTLHCSSLCHLLLSSQFLYCASHSSSYLPIRQVQRHPDLRPVLQEHVSSKAIWTGQLSSHCSRSPPPSAHTLPPVDCVESLKQSWQGHTV